MPLEPFRQRLSDYILSGHAFLHVPTTEKARFLTELKAVADALPGGGRQVFVWSQATGWRDGEGSPPTGVQLGQPDPQKVAQEILDLPEESIFVLKDFGFYVEQKTFSYADVVIAWLSEIRDVLASTGRTVIFLGPDFDVPAALANDVITVEFPLPDDAAIGQSVQFVMEGREFDETILPSIVSACRGMTQQQVEDRTALALRKHRTLNADAAKLILHEKAEVLRRSGLLKYTEPPAGGLELIGGCDNVKRHIQRDKACFTEEAQAFGIDPPRGVMLTGVSGCGKTQISLCAASELSIPLIQFDVGSVMSKWVGETEANVRNALHQVEAMAPCVLQMDEIEKGFGSVGHDGDSGASLRAFGTVLKWMSERTCPAYIIMTANDVSRLPPEFTRKGRIDEIYGIYLPTADERAEIFAIHVRLKGHDPEAFDLDKLASATEGYTGADVREVVLMGLKLAFHAGQELSTHHLLEAAPEIRPLSQTDPERVAATTEWLDGHTKPASGRGPSGDAAKLIGPKRRRKLAV
ncbi:MAG: AAA family ATPase [Planctomycetota bacterium]|jgi:ATP-dependent 26S proteasome regulatory subunit